MTKRGKSRMTSEGVKPTFGATTSEYRKSFDDVNATIQIQEWHKRPNTWESFFKDKLVFNRGEVLFFLILAFAVGYIIGGQWNPKTIHETIVFNQASIPPEEFWCSLDNNYAHMTLNKGSIPEGKTFICEITNTTFGFKIADKK